MVIEPLSSHHNRNGFDCGKREMSEFLQKTARQHADKDVGVTHVLVAEEGSPRILGYVTLTMKPVSREALPPAKGLPHGEYVVAFIGQLATDKAWQGQGIGKKLLYFALYKAQEVSEAFDLIGVALDLLSAEGEDAAETERRRRLYVDRGFKPLLDDENRLYLSMREIRKLGLT